MGTVGMVAIGPRVWGTAIPTKKVKAAILNTLEMSALGVQTDFDVVTATWDHKPDIEIVSEGEYKRTVVVKGKVFKLVTEGTSAHDIFPRNKRRLVFSRNYKAKTRPNGYIKSYAGGRSGPKVFARKVRHPGFSGRHFDKIIKRKWSKQFPIQMRRAVNIAIRSRKA